jgi:hypothetical protein
MKHGYGIIIFPNLDRSMFEGYFWEGKQKGLGRYIKNPKGKQKDEGR